MPELMTLFVHIIILVIVFALCYWALNLVCSILPAPIAPQVRVLLLVLLALVAISFLLGEFGMWGTWGWGYRRHV
jgi:uncharacterized membrane protein YwzB